MLAEIWNPDHPPANKLTDDQSVSLQWQKNRK